MPIGSLAKPPTLIEYCYTIHIKQTISTLVNILGRIQCIGQRRNSKDAKISILLTCIIHIHVIFRIQHEKFIFILTILTIGNKYYDYY